MGDDAQAEEKTMDWKLELIVLPVNDVDRVNVGDGEPGTTKGLHLVVDDIEAAQTHLDAAGVENSGVQHFEDGQMAPGPDPEGRDYGSFIFFSDPDGNSWAVQQVSGASSGR